MCNLDRHIFITFRSFVACGVVISVYFNQVLAVSHGQNVLWSQKDPYGISRIVGISGDPSEWIPIRRANTKYITAPNTDWHFQALAFDYAEQTLFWSDRGNKNIQALVLNGSTSAVTIFDSISSQVEGMAVDWINKNIYWTDGLYNWIIIASLTNHQAWRVLVTTDLDKPLGIAVHPARGYLFWSDYGDVPKIEASYLNGKGRRTLVNSRLTHPRGIAVDRINNRVFWVDAGRDTIESVNLYGNDRTQHFKMPGSSFYGIALYQSYVFFTDQASGKLRVFDSRNHFNLNFNLGATPYNVIMYDNHSQIISESPCTNFGCEHICTAQPDRQPNCMCEEGFKLRPDLKTCEKDTYDRLSAFIYSIGHSLCLLPALLPTMKVDNSSLPLEERCFLNSTNASITAMDYNWRQRSLYYTNYEFKVGSQGLATGYIMRTRLAEGLETDTVIENNGFITDLTVDWINSNLYFVDLNSKCIKVSKLDGRFQKKLICNLGEPSGLVADPITRYLYWTDAGDNPVLERSSLDGRNRSVMTRLDENANPKRLVIDYREKRLFWTDAEKGTIESINILGGGLKVDMSVTNSSLFGAAIFKDFIIWTNNGGEQNGVHAALKGSGEKLRSLLHPERTTVYDIIAYDKETQPGVGTDDPCASNGGCQQLCFPSYDRGSTLNRTCACQDLMELGNNGISCKSEYDKESFLLITDSSYKQLIMMDTDTYNTTVIPSTAHENPIALDYDWKEKRIYWTDVDTKVIKRAFINGSEEEVFRTLSPRSVTDGIAVDTATGLVYYTDTGLNVIAVASVNGKYHRNIITTHLDQPRAIVVNSSDGYIYWTDWGYPSKIVRAYMDGSHIEEVVSTGFLTWPNGLAVDYGAKRVYWCDAKFNEIKYYDLIRRASHTIQKSLVSHYFGLTLLGDYLYLTDWTRSKILKASLNGSEITEIGNPVFGRPNDIHAYSVTHTSVGTYHFCDVNNGGCEQLCLPVPNGRSCACSDGYMLKIDRVSCMSLNTPPPLTSLTSTASTTTSVPITLTVPTTASTSQLKTTVVITGGPTILSTSKTVPTKKPLKPVNPDKSNEINPGKSSPSQKNDKESMTKYVIVGAVAGTVVFITIIILVIVLFYRKWYKRKRGDHDSIVDALHPNDGGVWSDGTYMVPMEDRSGGKHEYNTLVDGESDNVDGMENPVYIDSDKSKLLGKNSVAPCS